MNTITERGYYWPPDAPDKEPDEEELFWDWMRDEYSCYESWALEKAIDFTRDRMSEKYELQRAYANRSSYEGESIMLRVWVMVEFLTMLDDRAQRARI